LIRGTILSEKATPLAFQCQLAQNLPISKSSRQFFAAIVTILNVLGPTTELVVGPEVIYVTWDAEMGQIYYILAQGSPPSLQISGNFALTVDSENDLCAAALGPLPSL
jgi:hypothetical protein